MANDDHGQAALPKLYGAPAYARPPVTPVQPVERPFDPDELPLASELSQEEQAPEGQIVARAYDGAASSGEASAPHERRSMLHGRPFRLRGFGGRHKGGGPDQGKG